MTFREWPLQHPFEVMNGSTRFGVKVSDRAALMFDTWTVEEIHFNKKVSNIRAVRGRLARTHDNRLIIVNELAKGVWSGYYVILTGTTQVSESDFDMLPVETGKRRDEVDIILRQLEKTREKERKLFYLLKIELLE
jgi:hypothetical protein